jgi:hypothetical protein
MFSFKVHEKNQVLLHSFISDEMQEGKGVFQTSIFQIRSLLLHNEGFLICNLYQLLFGLSNQG